MLDNNVKNSMEDYKTTYDMIPSFLCIENYITLFQEQSGIGWNQVIYGRLKVI